MADFYRDLVRRYRLAAGLTQEELATLADLDVRTISDIERGRTDRPRRSTVELLARALDRDDQALTAPPRAASHPHYEHSRPDPTPPAKNFGITAE